MMKKLLVIASLLAGVSAPVLAEAPTATPQGNAVSANAHSSQQSAQSVYRTERTILIENNDGTISETTITTVYYVFGYE